ncbi:MAG TPA: glycosyltransferase family 1 protein [Pyrinomonadaceae bacterium]|jgi:glycosyltransferase involved in cell wall biosynthesis|nr:glycosyltransferase family 1 protein [Pyrinomonadaceae bacterium]
MKVGVFLEDFSPDVGGGYTIQEDIFRALLDLMEETSHSFVLFCRRPEAFRSFLTTPRLQAVAFPGNLGQRVFARAQSGLNSLIESRKRQTRLEQLCKEAGVEFMWFVGAEAVQIDLPYMAIVWDLQHRLQPWFPEVSAGGTWRQRETFYGEYLRRATYIIAGTEAGRSEIERFYQVTSNRIKILPHPTPAFTLNAKPSDVAGVLKKYGLRSNYLFYPAQFWSHKNHANLLLAAAELKREHQLDLPVVFVGSNKGNEEYLRTFAAQLNPPVDVAFLGFVPLEDLVALYRGAFALAYVTFFGPENLPPLEAFALGCPVIASDVSGAREQLGDAALFVDPRNPAEIAGAIKQLHDDDTLRASLIDKGRARAERWTATEFVRGVFAALDEFEPVRRCWR